MTSEEWNMLDAHTAERIAREYYPRLPNKGISHRASTAFEDLWKWSKGFQAYVAAYKLDTRSNK